ncbi:MAG: PKD domain-containing protein [Thermoplasmata archaeon]
MRRFVIIFFLLLVILSAANCINKTVTSEQSYPLTVHISDFMNQTYEVTLVLLDMEGKEIWNVTSHLNASGPYARSYWIVSENITVTTGYYLLEVHLNDSRTAKLNIKVDECRTQVDVLITPDIVHIMSKPYSPLDIYVNNPTDSHEITLTLFNGEGEEIWNTTFLSNASSRTAFENVTTIPGYYLLRVYLDGNKIGEDNVGVGMFRGKVGVQISSSGIDIAQKTIDYGNEPPEIINYSAPNNSTLKENENFTFNVSAIDLDGDNLTYMWHFDNASVSNTTTYTLQTNYTSAGTHNITVVVFDSRYNTDQSWNLTVVNVNLKPMATIISATPNITKVGEGITLIGRGNDTDGSIVAYQWRTNSTILGMNSTIMLSNLSVGNHTIYFKVQDNDGDWSDEVSMTVEIKEKEKIDDKKTFIPFANVSTVILNILILAVLIDLTRRKK